MIRGVKVTQGRKCTVRPHQPITTDLLRKMGRVRLGKTPWKDGCMLWAAATLCFCGFLRSGEITIPTEAAFDEATHLTFSDLAVDKVQAPKVLKVHLKVSKTDPFRAGVDVYVGKTGTNLCPVGTMLDYLVVRGPGQGPLFRFSDGRPLTRGNFVVRVRQALTEAGVDSAPYSGHSFRIGAATTAAKAGMGDTTIKMLQSNAYQLYVKTPRQY